MNGGVKNMQRETAENGRNMTDRPVCAAQPQTDAPETPEILRREYRFVRFLGEGANAKTYLAVERVSGRRVAIKQLKSVTDFKSYDLFKREVETMRNVDVGGVPKYTDYIENPGSADDYYIVQDYIDGMAVSELLEKRAEHGLAFSEEAVWQFAQQIGDILWKLETQYKPPIIHRDIKPSNIIKTVDGSFYLIDFGAVANPERKSLSSTIAGTQGYMAPEQLMGDCAVQSDYYGLGATMLHMLTGVAPFKIDTDGMRLLFEDVINARAPQTSARMRSVLASLLAVKPADRPKNADALQKLLRTDFGDAVNESYLAEHPIAEKCGSFLSNHWFFRGLLRLLLGVPVALLWAKTAALSKRFGIYFLLFLGILFIGFFSSFPSTHDVDPGPIFLCVYFFCVYLGMSALLMWVCDSAVLSEDRESAQPCLFSALWHYEKLRPDDDESRGNSEPSGLCVATIQNVTGVREKTAYYTVTCDGDVYCGKFEFSPDRFDEDEFDRLCEQDPVRMDDFCAGVSCNEFLKGAKVNVLYIKDKNGYKFAPAQNQTDSRMICLKPWLMKAIYDEDFYCD